MNTIDMICLMNLLIMSRAKTPIAHGLRREYSDVIGDACNFHFNALFCPISSGLGIALFDLQMQYLLKAVIRA